MGHHSGNILYTESNKQKFYDTFSGIVRSLLALPLAPSTLENPENLLKCKSEVAKRQFLSCHKKSYYSMV